MEALPDPMMSPVPEVEPPRFAQYEHFRLRPKAVQGRLRSAPGDRQGVGGENPLR